MENFFVSKKRKHTEETKRKIREGRKNYLKNNPDKRSWQTRESGKSIPCEKLKKMLKDRGISFIEEYEPLLHLDRFFSIDISFPDIKVGVEINGRQHYDELGNLSPYYQKRHDLIEDDGWKLYEIPYYEAFNHNKMLEMFNLILKSPIKIKFDYTTYTRPPRKKKKYTPKHPNNVKHDYPDDKVIQELAKNHTLQDISKKLNIPKKAMWWHLKKRNIKSYRPPKKEKIKKDFDWWQRLYFESRKVERPNENDLRNMMRSMSLEKIGRDFGVSGNAVKKWCKSYGISWPKYRPKNW